MIEETNKIIEKLDKTSAKIMYVCNMVTQPGETDDFKVSDHLKVLADKIDVSMHYISQIESANPNKYFTLVVIGRIADALNIDIKELFDEENIDCDTILNNYVTINDGVIRHNVEKLSLDIYSYLVNE